MARSLSAFLVGTAAALSALSSQGQSPVLAEMYGRGVHFYYTGHLTEARDALSMAIDGGTEDPRPFYFRGLVNAACGDLGSAEVDWRMGAQKEMVSSNAGLVGISLKRVQGQTRLQLEKIRQQVRLEERNNAQSRGVNRAEEMQQVESKVLRGNATPPPATTNPFQREGSVTGEGTPKVDNSDPFKDDPVGTDPAAPAPDAMPPSDPSVDPFATPSAPGDAAPDPFGGPAPSGETPTNPFGGDNPF